MHETFFEAALSDAKALDEYFAQHKKPVGPLHGLPVSLKDQFHVKNVDTTMGYVGWIGTFEGNKDDKRHRTHESEMVRELRNLGAILYVKTSVPHTLMSGETVNNIIGYTWNPQNRNVCSGGSSGGEGALISLKGSPGGFGTDIGGSIRIPAAFCGLYGIRPSGGRLPYEGMANSMDGQNTILSVVGPLATTASAVRLLVKSILSQQPWLYDPLVVEMPWRSSQETELLSLINPTSSGSRKLSFGVLPHDGVISVHPPITRAISMITSTIHSLGHKTIPWTPPAHSTGYDLGLKTWTYDGGLDVHSAFSLSTETPSTQIQKVYGTTPTGKEATASEIASINRGLRAYRKQYTDYWNSTSAVTGTSAPADAFIMPLAPFPAAREGGYTYVGYSSIINALDYTAIVIPITHVDKTIDKADGFPTDYKPISDLDRETMATWDPEIYHGCPVSLQIVGRRFSEERLLVLAEWIGKALREGVGK